MDHQKTIRKLVSYVIFHSTLLTLILINSSSCTASKLGNETDQRALLEFKYGIADDPFEILSSWNVSRPYCQWQGVTCGRRHQRVTALDLRRHNFLGPISPHIGNLSFLRYLNLGNNRLHGEIPQEFGRLSRLKHLDLTNNTLGGTIPINLTYCTELKTLLLTRNQLTEKLPLGLGYLEKLVYLFLDSNKFRGEIPQSFGNLSSLQRISVGDNNLQGSVPNELSKLTSLTYFSVSLNNLFGRIPPSLYNISSINVFTTSANQLIGSLPIDIGSTLPNLKWFSIGGNRFAGTIPASLANASQLQLLDIASNSFIGQVPKNLGTLLDLQRLNLEENQLGSNSTQDLNFLVHLTNCSNLNHLAFDDNNIGGLLPHSIANMSIQLTDLGIGRNQIFGPIPEALASLINLYALGLEKNLLTGAIPSSFGRLQRLQILKLGMNQLSGQIPSSLGNLSQLTELVLDDNRLEGSIPESIGNCQKLQYLDLAQNNLSGPIPPQVLEISSLSWILNISQNSLDGPLPAEVGKLISLNALDISGNNLYEEIPTSIGYCLSLEYLNLQGNSFQGTIPSTLASLKGIQYLDLSQNNLSGKIPIYLQSFAYLQYLNLSFNDLEGEIPTRGAFGNASEISLSGNSKLCGGIPELRKPSCPAQSKKKKISFAFKLITALVSVILFLIAVTSFLYLFWRKKIKKVSLVPLGKDKLMRISYRELYKATSGFSSENLIGSGSFGSVYKGKLNQQLDKLIAVKVLNLQNSRASKSFVAECKILRNVRHRNLVKLLTYCSSIDSRHNEFKALVYEFMPNGNLDMWLHPDEANSSRTLNLLQRINIAIDVASALHYLHNHCKDPIVHCDLKPSNILLGNDMCAHVGDFGLARFLPKVTSDHSEFSTIGLKGSIGYAAPEYGVGSEVSADGDIYSYGIILLEMITGRRPTDDIFKDGLDLHNYVKKAFLKQVRQIMDPVLIREQEGAAVGEVEDKTDDEIVEMDEHEEHIASSSHGDVKLRTVIISILRVALACSEESPRNRMDMNDVTKELHRVKGAILRSRRNEN